MSELAKKLYGEVKYSDLFNDVALNDEWLLPSLMLPIANNFAKIRPFLNDVWQGRGLFLRKPVKFMSQEEIKQLSSDGENYFKNYLVGNPVNTILGKVNFKGNRATETRPEYMWLYPFSRYNLSRAKYNTPFPNVKPQKTNTEKFDNLKVDFLGKSYDYQIRNNKNDKSLDLYNIKDYNFLKNDIEKIKENQDLYQQFLDMQNK